MLITLLIKKFTIFKSCFHKMSVSLHLKVMN